MTREWLPFEVNRLVAAYKADDWNGVHASINRMLEMDRDGGMVLTAKEAALARDWYTRLPLGVTAADVALAQRLDP